MNGNVARIAEQFAVDGAVVSCELCGCGHINKTYMAVTHYGGDKLMTIYIDADACPVTRIAERVAREQGIPVCCCVTRIMF